MSSRFKNKYAQTTIFDELIEDNITFERLLGKYLNDVYDSRIKFLKRQAGKGMADILENLDAHVVDRATHMNQSANVIGIMADRLGLNSMLAANGMRGHDCGHPFGSHEGEEVLNEIGILLNAGFFHHNAKGIDVALSENIIEKFVEAVLNSITDPRKREEIENDPQTMERLENEAWYFLEFIVGHDGEATRSDLKIKRGGETPEFKTIKERVLYYTSKSNRTNKYKSEVSTLEAVLARPADIISYLKTDLENAFRKGIINEFSDNYLAIIGELLFEDEKIEPESDKEKQELRQKRIKSARKYIRSIERTKLRETRKDIFAKGAEGALEVVDRIIQQLDDVRNIYI